MPRTRARTRLLHTLTASAFAALLLAGAGSSAATAAPSEPASTSSTVAAVPQNGGGARGYVYWDWYWTGGNCIAAGNHGEDRGAWRDYRCRAFSIITGAGWFTIYNLYVKY